MRSYFVTFAAAAVLSTVVLPGTTIAASDMSACADERVKKSLLPVSTLKAAESACGRVLEKGGTNDLDRQRAAFYRGLMSFLQVVQNGLDGLKAQDGSINYSAPTLKQVQRSLADIEMAININGPLKADALALRTTVKQTIGQYVDAKADLETILGEGPTGATPLVQRAYEYQRTGDLSRALADLDEALKLEPKAGTALLARADVLRRFGQLLDARKDLDAAASLGAPFRRLALTLKSDVELRAGNLKAAYDDLAAALRELSDLPKDAAAASNADLLVKAGDLALDKLKDPSVAETHYREAGQLVQTNWNAKIGLSRVEEYRGDHNRAATIYKQILADTQSTPKLLERMLAAYRLKQLTFPGRTTSGPFRDAFEAGVLVSQSAPDKLKRVAFIIGEGDYTKLSSLPNARRDAVVMANALADMGFNEVKIAENLNRADLLNVPDAIEEVAAQADIVLVFYAGHGVEMDGANYLVAVDALPDSRSKLREQSLPLVDLAAAAARARRGALVIVDACRDDPFVEAATVEASRGARPSDIRAQPERRYGGLAAMHRLPPNNVVFHSTQPGQVALDGDGLNSPFVRALLETLAMPNQPLKTVVQETVKRVSTQTEGRQVPTAYGEPPAILLLPRPNAKN